MNYPMFYMKVSDDGSIRFFHGEDNKPLSIRSGEYVVSGGLDLLHIFCVIGDKKAAEKS